MIPQDPAELTPGALSALLGERVTDVAVVEQNEVTNFHAMLRVTFADREELLFCKLLPRDERRESVAASGMGVREALFYRRLAPRLSLRVPRMYAAEIDEDGRFLLLLEDLDGSGCTIPDGTVGVPPDQMAAALTDLAQMHVRYEDPSRRGDEASWVEQPRPTSDYGVRMLQYGLDNHRDRLRDAFAEIAELYIADRFALQEIWTQGPPTVIHGDCHLGNVFDDHGRLGFLDWGIISVNTPLREVSYFLTMAMDVSERRDHEVDLWHHYLDARRSLGGIDFDWDDVWLRHRVHAAYTVPASCQIVLFPDGIGERRRIFAEAFLERAQSAVEDLESRDALRTLGV